MLATTVKNLQNLIDAEDNIELIEIWEKVLYVRYKKGRNKFLSKKGLTEEKSGVYFNLRNYKDAYRNLITKYHPDRSRSKNALSISQNLNQWKMDLSGCEQREIDSGINLVNSISDTGDLPFEIFVSRVSFTKQQEDGFCYGFSTPGFVEQSEEEAAKLYSMAKEELNRQYNRNKKRQHH